MLLTLTEGENVALFGAVGLVAVALITAIPALLSRRASNDLADKVGEPNEHGNVMTILARLDDGMTQLRDGQARQDERMARTDERVAVLEASRVKNSSAIGELVGRVDTLERSYNTSKEG